MFWNYNVSGNSSGDEIAFPSFEQEIKPEKKPKQNKFDKKNCIIIIAVLSVLVILIIGIVLAVYFGSQEKETGGEIILTYLSNSNNTQYKLLTFPTLLQDKDYNIDYNNNTPFRLLREEKEHFLPEGVCRNHSKDCYVTITFYKVITNLEGMFSNITELRNASFAKFNSKKVINMNNLFSNCTNLEQVDFTGFNSRNLETMDSIFENCTKITQIDLNSFVTPKLNSMKAAFKNCSNLVTLNMENFILNSKVDIDNIFDGCKYLQNFTGGTNSDIINKQYDIIKNNISGCKKGDFTCAKCKELDNYNNITVCGECNVGYYNYSEIQVECSSCGADVDCGNDKRCQECQNNANKPDNTIDSTIPPGQLPSNTNLLLD